MESCRGSYFLLEPDLFRKPVPTFWDHALDEFAAGWRAQLPIAILTRAPNRGLALRQQLVERIAPAPLGIDDEPACLDRKADGSIRGEIERVEHGLGDRQHDRSPNFSQACGMRHDMILELYRNITCRQTANKR